MAAFTKSRRSFRSSQWILVGLLCAVMPLQHGKAQVSGISYTLAPLGQRIYFDKNAGLEDGTLVGGRVGFGFGEYIELGGVYLVSTGLTTGFDDFVDLGSEYRDRFAMLPPRDVGMRAYGADLKFNLGRGTILPYISLGTGILRFDPENLDESHHIYLTGSAGLQIGFSDNLSLLVRVEDLVYRYNPAHALLSEADLGDLGLDAGDFRQINVNNLAVQVGLQLYAGGRARGELTEADRALREQFRGGLSGLRLQIEPAGGIIDFDEELGFRERQRMAGVLAGFDLGPYLGLRGFFWRGVRPDAYTDFDNLQAYGGEIRLRFGRIAWRLTPHLLLGGGYLDVLEGYEGNGLAEPVDRPFASGGAGLSFPLTSALELRAGLRTLLLSAEDAENVSDPSQISINLFYSAGVSFGLGGRTPRPTPGRIVESTSPAGGELARVQREIDSLRTALQISQGLQTGAPDTAVAAITGATSGRWISIPLPAQGEVYLRYGEPGDRAIAETSTPRIVYVNPETGAVVEREQIDGQNEALSTDDIRRIVREVMQSELRGRERVVVDDAASSERIDLLLERIAELEARLSARDEIVQTRIVRRREGPSGFVLEAVIPFAGVGFSGAQIAMAGVRARLRSLSLAGPRFMPELVAAAGSEGTSYGLNADVAFPLGFTAGSLRPYAGLGLGLVTGEGSELVFNLLAGVEQVGLGGRWFAEYMSQDFFDLNRLIVGYRFSI